MAREACLKPPCQSPIACTGFDYCRERNSDPAFFRLPIEERRKIVRERR